MTTGSDPEPRLEEGEEWLTRREVIDLEGVSERAITDRIATGYYRSKKIGKNRLIAYKRKPDGSSAGTYTRSIPEDKPEESGTGSGSIPEEFWKEFYQMKAQLDVVNDRLKEKDELIAELKDRVSQDKEHIQAEKSRADMASNQLMNANALIKRRDDAPAQIVEPLESIEALQSRIKELETQPQPWWRKIIK